MTTRFVLVREIMLMLFLSVLLPGSATITISVLVTYRDLVEKKNIFEKTFTNYGDYDPQGSITDRTNAVTTAVDKISDDILLDTVSGW